MIDEKKHERKRAQTLPNLPNDFFLHAKSKMVMEEPFFLKVKNIKKEIPPTLTIKREKIDLIRKAKAKSLEEFKKVGKILTDLTQLPKLDEKIDEINLELEAASLETLKTQLINISIRLRYAYNYFLKMENKRLEKLEYDKDALMFLSMHI